ncbi:MAG: VCBS repeat-containing protein, partial [Candidatus Helarchaeota archaeon]|nr:VCBS repeat-containing protein [Candidatus Helarchaeota archaeon]
MTRKYKKVALFIIIFLNPFLISFNFNRLNSYSESGTNIKISTILESSNDWVSEVIDYDIEGGLLTMFDIVIADADNDGINEIVVCTHNFIYLYDYNGIGWTKYQVDSIDVGGAIDVGDADNDGDNEIVLVTGWSDNSVYIFEGAKSSWVKTLVKDTNDANGDVKIADADNDDNNEIIVASNKPGTNNYDRLLILN